MSTWTAVHPWTAFLGVWECLSLLFGVCWCLRAYRRSVCIFVGFKCVYGCIGKCSDLIWCRMLYIGKTSHTWQFWSIKIPKPPYIRSLKVIGFLHFLISLGPSEKDTVFNDHPVHITVLPEKYKKWSQDSTSLCYISLFSGCWNIDYITPGLKNLHSWTAN